jgi:hypothetical protein
VDLVCQVSLDLKDPQVTKVIKEILDVLACLETLETQVTGDLLEHLDSQESKETKECQFQDLEEEMVCLEDLEPMVSKEKVVIVVTEGFQEMHWRVPLVHLEDWVQ